jgi:hypothetical protein
VKPYDIVFNVHLLRGIRACVSSIPKSAISKICLVISIQSCEEKIHSNRQLGNNLHETGYKNGFTTSQHYKYAWTSADGKTYNQISHVLIDRNGNQVPKGLLDIQYFRGADCDTDQYLVTAKLGARLPVSKLTTQKFDMQRFDLKNLNTTRSKSQTGSQLC